MRKTSLLIITAAMITALGAALPPSAAAKDPLGITLTPTNTGEPPAATNTPEPTATPQPAATSTPLPTNTPRPASPPGHEGPTATPVPFTPTPIVAASTTTRFAPSTFLTKYVDSTQARVGDIVLYTLYVFNPTSAALTGVTVVDPLPLGLDLVSVSTTDGTFSYDVESRIFTLQLDKLSPGQTVTVVIRAKVTPEALESPKLTNIARFSSNEGEQHESNPVTVNPIPAGIPSMGNGPGPLRWIPIVGVGLMGLLLLVVGMRKLGGIEDR